MGKYPWTPLSGCFVLIVDKGQSHQILPLELVEPLVVQTSVVESQELRSLVVVEPVGIAVEQTQVAEVEQTLAEREHGTAVDIEAAQTLVVAAGQMMVEWELVETVQMQELVVLHIVAFVERKD